MSSKVQAQAVVKVCDLTEYSTVNGHALWLPGLPGVSSAIFLWDAQGGKLTIYDDDTARITGRVVHEWVNNYEWDVDIWLEKEKDYQAWTSLGRWIKAEYVPAAVVSANVQDWTFWELDSVKSRLTGVPTSFYAGDTLTLSHRPADRFYGFQLGIGANDKTGDFGLSGWLFYGGTYSGIGDLNCNTSCSDPPCTVAIDSVNTHCLNDSTFAAQVTISGPAGNYTLSDDQGTTALVGLSAGTYTFGSYANNTNVTFIVTDPGVVACADTVTGITADCTPPVVCDVALDSATAVCNSDSTFEVNIGFSGTSSSYTVTDNLGNVLLTSVAPGAYTVGNYPNNTAVVLIVSDDNLNACVVGTPSLTQDCTPPLVCDVAIDSASAVCTSDSTFEVNITFSGTGSYTVTDNQGNTLLTATAAGSYALGSYANNTSVVLTVTDDNIAGCAASTASLTQDCTPPPVCDVAISAATPSCSSDSTFSISVTFTGTGSSYSIIDDQGNSFLTNAAPGTYTVGSYPSNTLVILTVSDNNIANCTATTAAMSLDCTPAAICDVQIDSVVAVCVSDSSFNVSVTISGTGTDYSLMDNQSGQTQTGIPAGTYLFGPYANNAQVQFTVMDNNIAACMDTSAVVTKDCTPAPVCDINLTSASTVCTSDTTFAVIVSFTGTGSSYTISDNLGSAALTSVTAGTYTYGSYANNSSVQLIITDDNISGCMVMTSLQSADCTPPAACTVSIDSFQAVCKTDSSFELSVSFTGVGSNFQITDDQGSPALTGLTPGTYTFGEYLNSTDVLLTVSDPDSAGCTQTVGPVTADCTPVPVCDISLDSFYTQCLTDSTFEVVVTFSGTGSLFQIFDDQFSPVVFGLPAGTYSYGNYPAGTQVVVTVYDFAIFNCQASTPPVTDSCSSSVTSAVEITGLSYQVTNRNNVMLSWWVDQEPGNGTFYIERSEEWGPYVAISQQPTLQSNNMRQYFFQDDEVQPNIRYSYRIRREGQNGLESLSEIVEVLLLQTETLQLISLYPNPTQGDINLDISSTEEQLLRWEILDEWGRLLMYDDVNLGPGAHTLNVSTGRLISGMYLLRLSVAGETVSSQRIVKH
ncbi:MAG: T9SS type A sorting domain-containing protein [Bacteroidota bacterium]